METVVIKFTDEPDAGDKMKEECCPAQPYITFFNKNGVQKQFVNQQICTPLFTRNLDIYDGDNVEKICKRLLKTSKYIKGN